MSLSVMMLSSFQIPQIRYATPERLLQRLTDLRFLNIDFLNTFLLTYRVFTDGITVLEALKHVFFNPDPPLSASSSNEGSLENLQREADLPPPQHENLNINSTVAAAAAAAVTGISTPEGKRRISTCSGYSTATDSSHLAGGLTHGSCRNFSISSGSRRISGASSVSGYCSDDKASFSNDNGYLGYGVSGKTQHWRYSFRKCK